MSVEMIQSAVSDLMAVAGFSGAYRLHRLTGGANNQVFRVDADERHALLKVYFHHPDDPRNRLEAEFSFSTFAWEQGLRVLPQPLACDSEHHLGLYEFVQGRRVLSQELTEDLVRQALNFYRDINRNKWRPSARVLPPASEACFSIADYVRSVEWRLDKLLAIEESSELHREAAELIRGELSETWREVLEFVSQRTGALGVTVQEEIAVNDWCLSPSDFGFHNALWVDADRVAFIDFEYAGWDDPAKMVCDFFCQPAVPVPLDYLGLVTEGVASELSDPTSFLQRVALLMPLCRLKWCCILLNEFVPMGTARRRFSAGAEDADQRKAQQLRKAFHLLQTIPNKGPVAS